MKPKVSPWVLFLNKKDFQPIVYNDSPLMHKIRYNENFDLASFDMEKEIKHINVLGENALVLSVLMRNAKAFNKLQNEGFDLDYFSVLRSTLLFLAAKHFNAEIFSALLKRNKNLTFLNYEKKDFLSALCSNPFAEDKLIMESLNVYSSPYIQDLEYQNPLLCYLKKRNAPKTEVINRFFNKGFYDKAPNIVKIKIIDSLIVQKKIHCVLNKINKTLVEPDRTVEEFQDNQLFSRSSFGTYQGKIILNHHEANHIFSNSPHKEIGITNRGLIRKIYQNKLVNLPELTSDTLKISNFKMIYALEFFKKNFPEMDEQLFIPLTEESFYFPKKISSLALFKILYRLSPKRRVSLICNQKTRIDDHTLLDTLFMEDKIKSYCEKNNLSFEKLIHKKFKNLTEIHDFYSIFISKLDQENFSITDKIPNKILEINNQEFLGLTVFIPELSHDLIKVGQKMKICVGNGHYAEKMMVGDVSIITLKKVDKFEYCVEYDNRSGKIIQAKSFQNGPVPKEIEERLLKIIQNGNKK